MRSFFKRRGCKHVWLLRDDCISNASMTYELTFVCKTCGRVDHLSGEIEDAEQYDQWVSEHPPTK